MEALGATASVIAILQITTAILKYLNSLKGREADIKDIILRLETLKDVLYRLNDLEARSPSGALPGLSELHAGPIPRCYGEIHGLQDRLQKALGATGIRGVGKKFSWPDEKKEILKSLDRIDQTKMAFILALSSDHAQQGIDIKQSINVLDSRIASGRISDRHESILRWLNSGLDPSKIQLGAWKKHQPSTGDWLLCGSKYAEWKRGGRHSLMWLHGIPGCGKTVLCSTIINDLMWEVAPHQSSALAYFYYDFNEEHDKRTNTAMFRSLVGQLACQRKDMPRYIDDVYTTCAAGLRLPSEDQLCQMLLASIQGFSKVYVVVDALDESVDRAKFPEVLTKIKNLHVLTASRYIEDVALALQDFQPVEIVANARIEDIRLHVKARLALEPRLARLSAEVKTQIEEKLVNESGGMFRWVECQLEALRKCRTADGLTTTLHSLPKTLDETYERILGQFEDEDRELAIIAMQWLTFSARPLLLVELAEVLALRPGSIPDDLLAPEDVLAICSSLVVLDMDGFLRFSHFTVKEYLLSSRILDSQVSVFAMNKTQASKCIVHRSLEYLCLFDKPDSLDKVDSMHKALQSSPYTLKQFMASQDLCEMFSSRSSVPKPFQRCYRTDETIQELNRIAVRYEHRLLEYASLYWMLHTSHLLPPDKEELSHVFYRFFCNKQSYSNWLTIYNVVTLGSFTHDGTMEILRYSDNIKFAVRLGFTKAVAALLMNKLRDFLTQKLDPTQKVLDIQHTLSDLKRSSMSSHQVTATILSRVYPQQVADLQSSGPPSSWTGGDHLLWSCLQNETRLEVSQLSEEATKYRPLLIRLFLMNDCLEFMRQLHDWQSDGPMFELLSFAIVESTDRCIAFLFEGLSFDFRFDTFGAIPDAAPMLTMDDHFARSNDHPITIAAEARRLKIVQILLQHDQEHFRASDLTSQNETYCSAILRLIGTTPPDIVTGVQTPKLDCGPINLHTVGETERAIVSALATRIRDFRVLFGGGLEILCEAVKQARKAVILALIDASNEAQALSAFNYYHPIVSNQKLSRALTIRRNRGAVDVPEITQILMVKLGFEPAYKDAFHPLDYATDYVPGRGLAPIMQSALGPSRRTGHALGMIPQSQYQS